MPACSLSLSPLAAAGGVITRGVAGLAFRAGVSDGLGLGTSRLGQQTP